MDKKKNEVSLSRKDLEDIRKKIEADYINAKASEQYVPTIKTPGVSFSGHIDTSTDQVIEQPPRKNFARTTIAISTLTAFDGYCYDKEPEKASEAKKASVKIPKPKLTIKELLQDDEE